MDGDKTLEFFKEAVMVSRLKHENIIQFIGVCEEANFLVFELMEGPPLLNYLRSLRQKPDDRKLDDLVLICRDISKGCAYLEQIKCIHRDLATRNCMLSSLDVTVRKVSFFY